MNSKKHKKSSTSAIKLGFLMIDPIVLLAVVLGILFLLNKYKILNLYVGGDSLLIYIGCVLGYIVISGIVGIIGFAKSLTSNDTKATKQANMKGLIIEKIIVYMLGFIFCLVVGLNQGEKSLNIETEFLKEIDNIVLENNYTKTDCLICDLQYVKDDNSIKYEYNTYTEEVKIKTLNVELNLSYTDNLNDELLFLSKLYKDDITIYSNDINKMINEFKLNGTEQTFQDLNSDRQLTLRINKTTSVGKDYKLNYSIMGLNR